MPRRVLRPQTSPTSSRWTPPRRLCSGAATVLTLLCVPLALAQSIIVDNTDAGFTVLPGGAWSTSSATGQWGTDYRWKGTSESPAGLVEWRPDVPALFAGAFDVCVWYRSTGITRPNNAHYTIYHDGGSADAYVNQQINGSQWVVMGTYNFAAGTPGSVTLTSQAQAGKTIVADAVGFASRQPAFRGFWSDAFHAGFKSATEIDAMVARAVAGNYNAIVAEVLAYQDDVGDGHGAYWHSDIVPWAAETTVSFDPLAYLCQVAHAQGLEVHAWLVTYRISTTWPPAGNATLGAHPEWCMVPLAALGGGPSHVAGKYIFDPGSPDVQEYLVSIVRELVTDYPIDGINWDYVRYEQADAGYPADTTYTKSGLARFQQITGYVGTPPVTGEPSWDDFRRRGIDELVRRVRAEIPSITSNPRQPLRHTADLICFGDAPANFNSGDAYKLFQNWRMWMEKGWLDAGTPMNYKREHNASQAAWYRNWVDAALEWRYARHMYCGQADYLNSMANSVTQLRYVYSAGADGSMNYSYYATADQDLNGSWENDWTWYDYVSDNLFLTPVDTPTMPWRDPATAVEGTLWGRVTDAATGAGLDNATVTVAGQPAVFTDGNGYYTVTMLPADADGTAYAVTAAKFGYPERNGQALVPAGGVVRLDLPLGEDIPGDFDLDGDVDLQDFQQLEFCLLGPTVSYPAGHFCRRPDLDADSDVDLADCGVFVQLMP